MPYPLSSRHCDVRIASGISSTRESCRTAPIPRILNLNHHTTDKGVQYLTILLLCHLVERCGGQLQFSIRDIQQLRERLSIKIVQVQPGNDVTLRIIDRMPELQ